MSMKFSDARDSAAEEIAALYDQIADRVAAVARLKEAGDKMQARLERSPHTPSCYMSILDRGCTCGLDEALAAWREAVKESE